MPKLIANLLGPVQITLDDQPLAGFPYSHSRALLIYLAIESARPQRRERLAALLWPDQAEARHSLRQALATLRREIADTQAQPPALLVTRETIQLNPAGAASVDVHAFEALLAPVPGEQPEQMAQRLEQALALYRGDLLEQFGLPDSDELEEWVRRKRERLHGRALKALEYLAAYYEQTDALEQLQRVARRWLELDPLEEQAHRHLMSALAGSGQRSAALLQYETCRKVLANELGAVLDQDTTALYQRIQATSSVWKEPIVRLPPLPNHLIGREGDCAAIRALLQRDDVRLVTLTGAAGIGKTSLALQVAAEQPNSFPDGVFFVGLAPLDHAVQVLSTIAKMLDVEEGETALAAYLRQRRVLLLLDNWEHLTDAAPLLAELLLACPLLKVLATSRAPLRIRAERRYPVPPLALPLPTADLADIARAAAVELFVDRATAGVPSFALSAANAQVVALICRRLDGLPLAIELIAAQVEMLTPEALLDQLDRRFALEVNGPRDLPDRQRTLRDAISWSYARLPQREQALFAWLGVFRGGFDLEAVQTLIGGNPDAVAADLYALVDKSLVQRMSPVNVSVRFSLLETLRVYALERLAASGVQLEAQRRHAAIYAALAEALYQQVCGQEVRDLRQQLGREPDNLRTALAWLLEQDAEAALRMAGALGPFWGGFGYHNEGRRWLAQALACGGNDIRSRARALLADAALAAEQGQYAEAQHLAEASLALYRVLDDPGGAAKALHICAWIASSTRSPSEAEHLFIQSLELFRLADDAGGTIDALQGVAYVARVQDQIERATTLLRESIQIAQAHGKLEALAFAHYVQCGIDLWQGDYEAAARHGTEALDLYQRLGKRRDSAMAQGLIGEAFWLQGHLAPAYAMLSSVLVVFEEMDLQESIAGTQHILGQIERHRGCLGCAATYYRRSLTLSRQMNFVYFTALCLAGLGLLALAQTDVERATVLLGAGFAHIDALPPFLTPTDRAEYEQARQTLEQMLGSEAFGHLWTTGRALTSEQATSLALYPEMISHSSSSEIGVRAVEPEQEFKTFRDYL